MGKEYECKQVPVILYIPDNTIKLQIIATVMDNDDQLLEVTDTLRAARVAEARIDGEDWEDENVKYVLTDEAKAFLENGGSVEELLKE